MACPEVGTNAGDNAEIYLVYSTDGGTNCQGPTRINTVWTNDQWMPAIAVKPDGTELFVAWHDWRNDPDNGLIDAYGRFLAVTDGAVDFETGSDFRINTVSYPPVFVGTLPDTHSHLTNSGYYDPVYPPGGTKIVLYHHVSAGNGSRGRQKVQRSVPVLLVPAKRVD